jgi:hypothetical protein
MFTMLHLHQYLRGYGKELTVQCSMFNVLN